MKVETKTMLQIHGGISEYLSFPPKWMTPGNEKIGNGSCQKKCTVEMSGALVDMVTSATEKGGTHVSLDLPYPQKGKLVFNIHNYPLI